MVKLKGAHVPMLLVSLDFRVIHLTTNQTLSIKDSVFRVGVEGVLGGVTDTEEMNDPLETEPDDWLADKGKRTHSRSSSEKETHEGVIR